MTTERKHFVGWISSDMLKRGNDAIPVFRTSEIAHEQTGADTVCEVHVTLSGKKNISMSVLDFERAEKELRYHMLKR